MPSAPRSTAEVDPTAIGAGPAGPGLVARHRRVFLAVAALGVGAVVAAGCGSAAAISSPSTTVGASQPSTSVAAAKTVGAKLTEFHIALSKTALTAGRYTFVATNAGHTVHSLSIKGPGVNATLPSVLQPGKSGRMTVTLAAGKYDVFCPVGDHKQLGMNVEVTVGAGTASTVVTSPSAVGSGSNGY